MASVETPYGRIEWDGELKERTIVTQVTTDREGVTHTPQVPLSRIIAMTNGAVIRYLP